MWKARRGEQVREARAVERGISSAGRGVINTSLSTRAAQPIHINAAHSTTEDALMRTRPEPAICASSDPGDICADTARLDAYSRRRSVRVFGARRSGAGSAVSSAKPEVTPESGRPRNSVSRLPFFPRVSRRRFVPLGGYGSKSPNAGPCLYAAGCWASGLGRHPDRSATLADSFREQPGSKRGERGTRTGRSWPPRYALRRARNVAD